ncbi:MAG: NAD(P)H-hydrate dehydratase [Bacteroidetes bacterium]|nr:NAD(P)H-hydrate dehydratase [Bacteroidota bacterium]
MKIFSAEQVRKADAYTIEHEPVNSIDLMERASVQCYEWLLAKLAGRNPVFYIFCGPGNNGGDGLAIARMLWKANYMVRVAIPDEERKYSNDFRMNHTRLRESGIKPVYYSEALSWEPGESDIIIDAIFGSGLSKPISGLASEVIHFINRLDSFVVSIDIPSGLFVDHPVQKESPVVNADYTLSFQFPKLAFLFAENDLHVGEWTVLPIGLDAEMIDSEACSNFFTTKSTIKSLVKVRRKFSHKGTYGHALLISGSYGKTGAAVLSSKACLRSGVGLLTTHIPSSGYSILQSSVPEAMLSLDANDKECSRPPDLSPYNAVGVGPGLGTSAEAKSLMRLLIQDCKIPMVLDADALNILSEEKTWQAFIPVGSILTPHPKEFERLAGKSSNGFETLEKLKEYCIRHKVYIVLKGAYTITCTPSGTCFFNSTGNSGMATGGSGDVLTGIITGLLAQHYTALDACLLGVYLHGLSGDLAADESGKQAVIAGDIIQYIGRAYKKIESITAD